MSPDPPKLTRSMSKRFYRFDSLAEQLAEVLGRHQCDPNLWVFEIGWEVANKGKSILAISFQILFINNLRFY